MVFILRGNGNVLDKKHTFKGREQPSENKCLQGCGGNPLITHLGYATYPPDSKINLVSNH